MEAAHQLHAERRDVADAAARIDHVAPFGVEVGTVGIPRARDADVVAVIGREAAERDEQVVVARLRAVEHVAAFDRRVVAAREMFAVTLPRQRLCRLLIHLQDENAARVGAVGHPQLAVLVVEDIGVDGVRMTRAS